MASIRLLKIHTVAQAEAIHDVYVFFFFLYVPIKTIKLNNILLSLELPSVLIGN